MKKKGIIKAKVKASNSLIFSLCSYFLCSVRCIIIPAMNAPIIGPSSNFFAITAVIRAKIKGYMNSAFIFGVLVSAAKLMGSARKSRCA